MNSDHYVKLLKIYFTDNNIGLEKKKIILEGNPFNYKFTKWENKYIKGNKAIAHEIERQKLIKNNTITHEITDLEEESISKYLSNNKKQGYDFNNRNNSITLIRDYSVASKTYLNDLIKNKKHFILGFATPYKDTYLDKINLYNKIIKNQKDITMYRQSEEDINVCIISK